MTAELDAWIDKMPIIAIIRGVLPSQAVDVGTAIYEAGIGIIEVPLNSPAPFESIKRLNKTLGDKCIIGCGTLLSNENARRVADAGGKIAITPNTNPSIIKCCIDLGLTPIPGWATPTEALLAYQAGARYLKLFPAATYGVKHMQAVRAVLPDDAKILAVGGIGSSKAIKEWLTAGACGLGIGSEIYNAGRNPSEVHQRALEIARATRLSCSTYTEQIHK
ncbi:MAG: 2-dehydro-3-deoxy-6-phosphogalactonate aldolase [Arenicella sp.]|nr:2-dehydro-3-deoxy-6-phosphogalactonate aldolase [Arenicella sp.]